MAYLWVRSQHGKRKVRIEIVRDMPKKAKVVFLENTFIPGNGHYYKAGDMAKVPRADIGKD